jgi:hypothetical protein
MGMKVRLTINVEDIGFDLTEDDRVIFSSRLPVWERKPPLPVRMPREKSLAPVGPLGDGNMVLSPKIVKALKAYRPTHGRLDIPLLKVWKLHQQGLSHDAIGQKYHCSDVLIGHRLRVIRELFNNNGNGNGNGNGKKHKRVMYLRPDVARKVGVVR